MGTFSADPSSSQWSTTLGIGGSSTVSSGFVYDIRVEFEPKFGIVGFWGLEEAEVMVALLVKFLEGLVERGTVDVDVAVVALP